MSAHQYPKFYLYKRLVQAKLFIDAHFSEAIDLETIADEACFSKFHFIRLFKEAYGKTPHQYLASVRLDKARALLSEAMPVTDVCLAVGFESLGSFSVKFKQAFGVTPSAYLLQQQQRKAALRAQPLKFIPACMALKQGWL